MIRVIATLLAGASICATSCACEGDAQAWSARFLAMKTVRGHFDGGPWVADVDRFGGTKHELMKCLSSRAVAQRIDAAQLLRWMGQPDEMSEHPPTWVYRWRGAHDRLAFSLRDGHVVQANWLLALE